MSSAHIAAVIVSAGLSSRMGAFKPLLPLGKSTLIGHVIEAVKIAGIEEILVVVGHRADALAPVVAAAGAAAVFNPEFARGMFSSVCAGVKRLSPGAAAFFLLPVDIPLVRPATFRRLADAWQAAPDRIVHPVFDGQRGHPPLVPADLVSAILSSPGQGGLRAVLEQHEKRFLAVPVADENILFDIDRTEDYEAANVRCRRLGDPSAAECEAILSEVCPADETIIRHGRQVQKAASAVCRALNRAGAALDENLVAAAALLHDMAKGAADHAAAGGKILTALGFERVGAVVAAHTDLPEEEIRRPEEAAVVYLADKLVAKDRFVCLESRFDAALARYGGDPEARAAVARRRSAAVAVRKNVEKATGLSLDQILSAAGIHLEGK